MMRSTDGTVVGFSLIKEKKMEMVKDILSRDGLHNFTLHGDDEGVYCFDNKQPYEYYKGWTIKQAILHLEYVFGLVNFT